MSDLMVLATPSVKEALLAHIEADTLETAVTKSDNGTSFTDVAFDLKVLGEISKLLREAG